MFRSWDAPKAVSYRRLNGISDEAGTAVTVQTMVFGNAGGGSGSGVAFTRNPATGTRELYFDFQFNAQGEDVVAGRQRLRDKDRLRVVLPAVWARLNDICHELGERCSTMRRISSSPSNPACCSCCRHDAPSARIGRRWRSRWTWLRKGCSRRPRRSQLDGIDLDAVVRTSFAPPVPETLAVAQVAGMGVASGAIALDSDAVKRLSQRGHRQSSCGARR